LILGLTSDTKGSLLLALTVGLVLLGSGLAYVGLRKLAEATDNTKEATKNLADAAQQTNELAQNLPAIIGGASDALAEMKGPLAPARYVFALALAAFAGALVAWGLVDFTASADQGTTTTVTTTTQ